MMGGGKAKAKKGNVQEEPVESIMRGSFELTIGTKVEAMDYLGNWYGAKVSKVHKGKKEVLVHFDGWNSRFDVWLPYNSNKLRPPRTTSKSKMKEKEWRIGDRVIAKWGPAGKLYPATISKLLNEATVEVIFYDGFKKTINKASLKADSEKLYRQYEYSLRKNIISPLKFTPPATETIKPIPVKIGEGRTKRRLTEPAAMADYVTDLHAKRRSKKGSEKSTSEDDRSSLTSPSSSSVLKKPVFKDNTIHPAIEPKVSLKVSKKSVTLCNEDAKQPSDPLIITQSKATTPSVEIVKKNDKSYMMFPVASPDDEIETPNKLKRGAPVELSSENKELITKETENAEDCCRYDSSLKVCFPFHSKSKTILEPEEKTRSGIKLQETSFDLEDQKNEKSKVIVKETEIEVKKFGVEGERQKRKIKPSERMKESSLMKSNLEKKRPIKNNTKETTSQNIKHEKSPKISSKVSPSKAKATDEKHTTKDSKQDKGVTRFEDKYEMFKLKWKAEKEKRRRTLGTEESFKERKVAKEFNKDSVKTEGNDLSLKQDLEISKDNLSTEGEDKKNSELDLNKSSMQDTLTNASIALHPTGRRGRPRIKLTPSSRFGRGGGQGRGIIRGLTTAGNMRKRGRPRKETIIAKLPVVQDKKEPFNDDVNVVGTENVEKVKTLNKDEEPILTDISDKPAVVKPKTRGWPKGRPRKKKRDQDIDYCPDGNMPIGIDISRTPNMSDTLSMASMVEEERPSQRKRPDYVLPYPNNKQTLSKQFQGKPPNSRLFIQGPNRSFIYQPIRPPFPTAAQIVAAKIQKRVHQQKMMSLVPQMTDQLVPFKLQSERLNNPSQLVERRQTPCSEADTNIKDSSNTDSDDAIIVVHPSGDTKKDVGDQGNNEIDLTNIKLQNNKPVSTYLTPVTKKRKSLDFITGRLNYKQRMEEMKQKGQGVSDRFSQCQQEVTQQGYLAQQKKNVSDRKGHTYDINQPVVSRPLIATTPHATIASGPFSPVSYSSNEPSISFTSDAVHSQPSLVQQPLPFISNNTTQHTISTRLMPQINPNQPLPEFAQNIIHTQSPSQQISPSYRQNFRQFFPQHRAVVVSQGNSCQSCRHKNCICSQHVANVPLLQQHQMQQRYASIVQPGYPPRVGLPGQLTVVTRPLEHILVQPHSSSIVRPTRLPLSNHQQRPMTALAQHFPSISKAGSNPIPIRPKDPTPSADSSRSPNVDALVGNQCKVEQKEDLKNTAKKKKKRKHTDKEEGYPLRKDKKARLDADGKVLAPKEFNAEMQLVEYKCIVRGCNKSFRKSHLLEYHRKYFHTLKPITKRGRSSVSVSSTESNPPSRLTSPVDSTGKIIKHEEANRSISVVTEGEETESETESESYDEIPSVDDCVKCICEDECELGFMIQCEQCFTWQHGECVGYSQQKSVPLFYLCHICSNPKGLRKSEKYSNDYTWYRHGQFPPVSKTKDIKETKEIIDDTIDRPVDPENEEVLSSIMLATHGMVAELSNIRDVLKEIRDKFIMFKDVNHPEISAWISDDKDIEEIIESIGNIKEDNTVRNDDMAINEKDNRVKNNDVAISEKFDKDLNDMIELVQKKKEIDQLKFNSTVPEEKISDLIALAMNNSTPDTPQPSMKDSTAKNVHGKKETSVQTSLQDEKTTSKKLTTMKSDRLYDKNEAKISDTTGENDDSIPYMEVDQKDWNDRSIASTRNTIDAKATSLHQGKLKTKKKSVKNIECLQTIFDETNLTNATEESLIARYNLLSEVEKIEEEIAKRLNLVDTRLEELEEEYNSIDKPKAILEDFKMKFKLPDMKVLLPFLNQIKWTSILNKTKHKTLLSISTS